MKLEKLESLPQVVVCLCVPHLLQKQHKEFICENLKQQIRVLNIPFSRNQAWKRNFKHNFIPLHTRNIFSLVHVVGPKGYNSDPLNLF
jgi:hypothetical protein